MKRSVYIFSMLSLMTFQSHAQVLWSNNNIGQMLNAGFDCRNNQCTSTDEIQDLTIDSVGNIDNPADLVVNNNLAGYVNQAAIIVHGTNYMNMQINSSLNGFFGISMDHTTYTGGMVFGPNSIVYGSQNAVQIQNSTFTGDIVNNGHLNNKYWHGLALVGTTMNGNIKNSKFWRGGYNGILIDQNSHLNGYIYNSGEIHSTYGDIYNQSSHMLDYRGSGDVKQIHTMGGIELSDMTRKPINDITGQGGVIYSDQGGATTLHISYGDNDRQDAKIKSNIGDLTLRNISISLEISTENMFYSGTYKIAESSTVIHAENITWLIDGNPISSSEYSTIIRGNGTNELWLDIIGNY